MMPTKRPALSVTQNDRQALIESARRAVFQDGHTSRSAGVEPWVDRSWRRCLAQGLQPQQRVSFDPVSSATMERVLEASQPLLRAAAPVIRSLARAMADTGYFAILTDAQGLVIDVNGPIDHQNRLAHLIARVGVDLSEGAVGTTAIGATLAELQPVWLHRGEHFFEDTSAYSCAGAPLFGPDGQCVGMLDLTGINVTERPALKHLVSQSALSIGNALTLAQPHRVLLRLNWPGRAAGEDSEGLVCLDDDGHIRGANRAAVAMLMLPAGEPWPHCSDVFAVPPDSLFDAARAQRGSAELPLWSGLRLDVRANLSSGLATTENRRPAGSASAPLKDVQAAWIRRAVQEAKGNVTEAARALGISRATVYRKLTRKKTGD